MLCAKKYVFLCVCECGYGCFCMHTSWYCKTLWTCFLFSLFSVTTAFFLFQLFPITKIKQQFWQQNDLLGSLPQDFVRLSFKHIVLDSQLGFQAHGKPYAVSLTFQTGEEPRDFPALVLNSFSLTPQLSELWSQTKPSWPPFPELSFFANHSTTNPWKAILHNLEQVKGTVSNSHPPPYCSHPVTKQNSNTQCTLGAIRLNIFGTETTSSTAC